MIRREKQMKRTKRVLLVFSCITMFLLTIVITTATKVKAANPYLPLWEHIPDGEPKVFQDPDDPTGTKQRVYIFGSHDLKRDNYCGPDIACWSAPLSDPNNWRNDGPIFTSFNENNGWWDRLFAPDIVELRTKASTLDPGDPRRAKAKENGIIYEYYLYPHNISDDLLSFNGLRMSMVAKADRPDGPFEVINWTDPNDRTLDTLGPIGFDPGAFIDYDENDDVQGVYVFWGFQTSTAGEMDPETMYTLKEDSPYTYKMYTDETFKDLTDAIADAKTVNDNPAATQDEVDDAVKAIIATFPDLVRVYEPKTDPIPLKAAMIIGKAMVGKFPGRYTENSIAALTSATTTGESRINYGGRNSTQTLINTALSGIVAAINNLEEESSYIPGSVNKEVLHAAIKRSESIYNRRPVDFMIPSNASTDGDYSYPLVHDRAKTKYNYDPGSTAGRNALRTAFGFFEASSIRKVGNKYVMVYSGQSGSEYGVGNSSSTLRYCYGDTPMGPWVDGGVLVDSRGPDVNQAGTGIGLTNWGSNTHGSILELKSTNTDGSTNTNPNAPSQWYVFYHRPPRGNGNARQSAVAPIKVEWDERSVDDGGSVRIYGYDPYAANQRWTAKTSTGTEYPGAEVTSEGFNPYGLPPYEYYSAGIACYFVNNNPGSVINSLQDTYDTWDDNSPVTGLQSNHILGFKYFDFENYTRRGNNTQFDLYLRPTTTDAFAVDIMMDTPWEGVRGGTKIGEINVPANSKQVKTKFSAPVTAVDGIGKKHSIYLKVRGDTGSLCDILGIGFSKGETMFEDDFSDLASTSNWTLGGTAKIEEGLLKLSAANDSAITKRGQNWRNYEFVSNVKLEAGDLGIRFMRSGSGDYYELKMKANGGLALSYTKGGTSTVLQEAEGAFTLGASVRVSVGAKDGVISIRIDGELVMQAKNDDYDHGAVEFAAGADTLAEVDSVLVCNSTEQETSMTSIRVEVDGNPINVAQIHYTPFNGIYDYETYEAYYPVSPTLTGETDQSKMPKIEAFCDDKDVKISITYPQKLPGVALVRFNKGGSYKTYMITFSPGARIRPEADGKAYSDPAKAEGDVVDLGKLSDLIPAEVFKDGSGDWEMWVNVATDISPLGQSNDQAGFAICDGGADSTLNYFRVNTRRQSATQVGASAGWRLDGGTAANGTNRNFNAAHYNYYIRIVKKGDTLQAFTMTSTGLPGIWQDLGTAQTFSAQDFFKNARLQAYATNASSGENVNEFTATMAVVPDILGVQSTVYSTYEQFTEEQIAVDGAASVIGDGIAYKAADAGTSAVEKMNAAIAAKLNAAGTVSIKKATDSQVKKMNYDVNLSTFVFDSCTISAAPGEESTGPFTLTLKAGRSEMIINQYKAVDITGKEFSDLMELIETAKGKKKVDYPESSWSRLQDALKKAEALMASDDPVKIADAYDKLNTAVVKLEDATDKAVLTAVVAGAKLIINTEGRYTDDSFTALTASIEAGETVLANGNATQEQVNNAAADIMTKIADLVLADPAIPVNKEVLTSVIAGAKTITNTEGRYTADSFAALTTAIGTGDALLADENATQAQADNAVTDIMAKVAALVLTDPTIPIDNDTLTATAASAKTIRNEDGKYTATSFAALADAIESGERVLADTNATQAQVNNAIMDITARMAALVLTEPVILVDKAVLTETVASAGTISNANGKYTEDSFAALTTAISAGEGLLNDPGATQMQVNNAIKNIIDSITALVVKEPTPPVVQYADKSKLVGAINKAKAIKRADYTAASVARMTNALSVAENLNGLTLSKDLQSVVDTATASLNEAIKVLMPAVGTTHNMGSLRYKVTSTNTVNVISVVKKNQKNIKIPATVTIKGHKYNVIGIANNAFKKNKNLKTVTLGTNIVSIGKQAFYGCSNLRKIKVKSKLLSSVGKNAFKGIAKKATIRVPAAKLDIYRVLMKGKGQRKSVKIRK